MRSLFFIAIIFQFLLLSGCKQEVGFSPLEGEERSSQVTPPPGQPHGPVVKILQPPRDVMYDESNESVFEVIQGDAEIFEVVCLVDQEPWECDTEKGVVKLKNVSEGDHQFEVVAVDVEGLVGRASENWLVASQFMKVTDELSVSKKNTKTDILFVVDNSGSMYEEQKKISERFSKFINQLKKINWHIAITTTDPRTDQRWGDGRIDPFDNGDYYLTPELSEKKAQLLFSSKVRREEAGWNTEVGIEMTYRAIQRAGSSLDTVDQELGRFFRKDASLAVVVVSDENESGNGYKNNGDNLIKLVESKWGRNKVFSFHSIIVHTQACLNKESFSGATMGVEYERLSRKTSGVIGDICASNYSQMLTELGKEVASLTKVHNLKCDPQDMDQDGKVDLKIVSKNGKKIPGYSINKRRIDFDKALNPDDYVFHYYCLK